MIRRPPRSTLFPYTDALPILFCFELNFFGINQLNCCESKEKKRFSRFTDCFGLWWLTNQSGLHGRSEEHTSELQSRQYLVCRLLLEKKKTKIKLILSA